MKKIVVSFLMIISLFTGCDTSEEPKSERKVETERLSFTVQFPSNVETNAEFTVKGEIENISDYELTLNHARPPMILSLADQGNGTEDISLETILEPEESITFEREFVIDQEGVYILNARTTGLRVNGEYIEGKGNDRYIEGSMTKTLRKIEKSKLSITPAEIMVEN